MNKPINSFDIDGVLWMGHSFNGVHPGADDIIITGRSIDERPETLAMLEDKGIHNPVYFQWTKFENKTREGSGQHKGNVLLALREQGIHIGIHFEDDEIQIAEILKIVPDQKIVHLKHNLVPKHNVSHKNYIAKV